MNVANLLALLFRPVIMMVVYYILTVKFRRDYRKSKEAGFENKYFRGFTVLFSILFMVQLLYGLYEVYNGLWGDPLGIKDQFSWYIKRDDSIGAIINNQMRPLYLIFYMIINGVFAAQIYPVEQAYGWKKNPVMKTILVFGSTLILLFIPQIGNSDFAVVPVVLGFIGISLGLIMNVVINSILAVKSTGEVRKRAIDAVIAFILLGVGVLWSLEVGFTRAIVGEDVSYRWDVVIGSILQIIGSLFYVKGFSSENLYDDAEPPHNPFGEVIKGNFTPFDLRDWIVIGTILGLGFILLAWFTYPKENNYSIMKDTISFLGSSDPDNNPEGWWLLSIALAILSLFFVPLSLYRWKRLRAANKAVATLALIFYLLASVGLFLVGIFPDNQGESFFADLSAGRVHNLVAAVAFGGFAFGLIFEFFVFIYDALKTHYFKKWPWAVAYSVFFFLVAIVAYTQSKRTEWPGDGIYSFPMWEWIVFLSMLGIFYLILLTLPNKMNGNGPKYGSKPAK